MVSFIMFMHRKTHARSSKTVAGTCYIIFRHPYFFSNIMTIYGHVGADTYTRTHTRGQNVLLRNRYGFITYGFTPSSTTSVLNLFVINSKKNIFYVK